MLQKRHSGNGAEVKTAVPNASESSTPIYQNCPYFGLPDDADTSLLFPSSAGCCHRATPPELVQLTHQETHCLTARHKSCPIYLRPAPLPAALRAGAERVGNGRSWGKILLTLLLLLLVATLAVAWNNGLIALATLPEPVMTPATPTPVVAALPTRMPTSEQIALIVPSPTPTPPTATPVPTAIPPSTVTPIPTVALPATFTPAPAPPQARIAVVPINVRAGPDTSYPVLQIIRLVGERYDITAQAAGGGWWQICCVNGMIGWVAAEGVNLEGELAEVPVLPPPNPQVRVLAERLNVRSGPSQAYPVLTVLNANEVLDVSGRLADNTWWQICCINEDVAWVFGEGVELWGIAEVVPIIAPPEP